MVLLTMSKDTNYIQNIFGKVSSIQFACQKSRTEQNPFAEVSINDILIFSYRRPPFILIYISFPPYLRIHILASMFASKSGDNLNHLEPFPAPEFARLFPLLQACLVFHIS